MGRGQSSRRGSHSLGLVCNHSLVPSSNLRVSTGTMPVEQRVNAHASDALAALRPHEGLQFKLAALLVVLVLLLGGAALVVGKLLVRDGLVTQTFRYESESGRRIAQQFDDLALRAETLGNTLAKLAASSPGGPAALRSSVAPLTALLPDNGVIVGVGLWPETGGGERSSLYWLRDASGTLQPRSDYNDPRTVPYDHEKWYTPARYSQRDRCYWTPAYREPLLRRDVVTCTLPLHGVQGFAGAVTVSLGVQELEALFARATDGDIGYSLLLDHGSRLLAVSPRAVHIGDGKTRPRNLAELGQMQPALNPLALAVHQLDGDRATQAARTPQFGPAQAAALQAGSREMSRQEAEAALAALWAAQNPPAATAPQRLDIDSDPVLGADAFATLFPLPGADWHLVRVTPMKQGFAGADHIFMQTLLVNAGAIALTLLALYFGLRYLVVGPLRRMTAALANSGSVEDSLHVALDERPRNELGLLAYWHNERIRQMRELMERAITTNAQLVMESEERRNAQEALARMQERAALALQSVADGVIIADVNGRVDDMNPVAEQLTGVPLRGGRGKAFNEVFSARTGNSAVMPNLAELSVQRGARLDYPNGLILQSRDGEQHEVHLTVTPIRTRQNRLVGSVVVFRKKSAPVEMAPAPVAEPDLTTGLPRRADCDRRVSALIDAARLDRSSHALLVADLDQLKRINDTAGLQAGDEAIVHAGVALAAAVGAAGEVFRLGGDQFAVVLRNLDAERAGGFAETLRKALAASPLEWESRRYPMTVSIGFAPFGGDASSAADVMQRAELACRAAKRNGRNRVQAWQDDLNPQHQQVDDAVWVRRLRAGLDGNLLHLTTQFIQSGNAHAGEGNAFEVLLALEDEEGFWSTSTAFMPAAQRHNLTTELDRWVVSRTLTHLARNPAMLPNLAFVNINLSAQSLAEPSMIEYIVRAFENLPAVPANRICFEFAEEALTGHPQQAQLFCESLHGIGCRLSVDHFSGRRISDVGLLRRLPLDFVKVDSAQFRNIANDPVEQMMAESLMRLAHTLRKRVITAQLEDGARLDTWRRLGADYFQGHIVSKPTPVIFTPPRAA
ncbi:MAG: EAL domain-containing protein [Nevskiaceae bacterium]|nr:MAG: EAL domain-containing protein [Nevskiaceae bacterium]